MATIKLANVFNSIKNSNFIDGKGEQNIISSKSTETKILITPDNVDADEKYVFEQFLAGCGVDPSVVTNYGVSTYGKGDAHTWFCPAYLGVKPGTDTDNPVMALMIGANNDEHEAVYVPVEVEQREVTRGRKTLTENVYIVGESEMTISEAQTEEGKIVFYIQLQVVLDDGDTVGFQFPFLIDKKAEYSDADIKIAWRDGQFQNILREFGSGGGARCWLSVNKCFTQSFADGSFPEDGVFLLAKNGTIRITAAGSHPNIKQDIVQADWEIIGTSHPEMTVQYIDRDKKTVDTFLRDATNMQFTSAEKNNEGYNWLIENGFREYPGVVLLHIVEPSSRNIKHTPVNTCTNNQNRIRRYVKQYPELSAMFDTQPKTTPAIAAGSEHVPTMIKTLDITPEEKAELESF